MWEAVMQSGRLVLGVLLAFAAFMTVLVVMERGIKRRRRTAHATRGALQKQNKAA